MEKQDSRKEYRVLSLIAEDQIANRSITIFVKDCKELHGDCFLIKMYKRKYTVSTARNIQNTR